MNERIIRNRIALYLYSKSLCLCATNKRLKNTGDPQWQAMREECTIITNISANILNKRITVLKNNRPERASGLFCQDRNKARERVVNFRWCQLY